MICSTTSCLDELISFVLLISSVATAVMSLVAVKVFTRSLVSTPARQGDEKGERVEEGGGGTNH